MIRHTRLIRHSCSMWMLFLHGARFTKCTASAEQLDQQYIESVCSRADLSTLFGPKGDFSTVLISLGQWGNTSSAELYHLALVSSMLLTLFSTRCTASAARPTQFAPCHRQCRNYTLQGFTEIFTMHYMSHRHVNPAWQPHIICPLHTASLQSSKLLNASSCIITCPTSGSGVIVSHHHD